MIESKSILQVKSYISGVYSDITYKMREFQRDIITESLETTDYLYVGYDKPINCFYINLNSSLIESSMNMEYYNGSSWVSLDGLEEDTIGLSRSGFIRWNREQINQTIHTIDNSNKYWYRLSCNSVRTNLILAGINLIFSNDYDLLMEQPYITMTEFLGGQTSHILIHNSVKNEIIQYFRTKDYYKTDSNGLKQDINIWDLLEIDEVKQAAILLAISKIYFNQSDAKGDVWESKAYEYRARYTKIIEAGSLSIDFNDNGKKDIDENKTNKLNTFFMSR